MVKQLRYFFKKIFIAKLQMWKWNLPILDDLQSDTIIFWPLVLYLGKIDYKNGNAQLNEYRHANYLREGFF